MESMMSRIRKTMLDHEWRSVDALCAIVNGSPMSVSATIRALRRPKYGGFTIEIRNTGKGSEYRIAPAVKPTTVETPKPQTVTAEAEAPQVKPAPKRAARNTRPKYIDPSGLTMGQIIRGRRTQLFISQEQLADLVGVQMQTVGRWERFNQHPRSNKIDPICKALGISREGLLSGKTKPVKPSAVKPRANKSTPVNGIDINALALAIAEALKKAST